MIEAQQVCVAIGGKSVLHAVDFTARAGEVTAIIGPNGSGKTTLLRAITGDIAHTGRVAINGVDLKALKPWQAATMRAVLPQASVLSFPFTVREVVALGLIAGRAGVMQHEAASLPERALARVDLEGFAGRFYQELSGGEQQRVQLARVLCQVWLPVLDGQPRFLLLDEPIASLDIKHQLAIMRIAADFARDGGGVVAVLHDLNLAAMFADRLLAMQRGRAVAFGAPDAVLRDEIVNTVFDCDLRVGLTPRPGTPFLLPQSSAGH
ncbi:MAG TPA: heme ABC transporter ATP-binding protein [Devosiaceae bacterium]|jgi:iron complex transport system ATP-binding protein